MAAIGASNVTFTISGRSPSPKKLEGYKEAKVAIAFGNGALTYPSGGIPLSGLSAAGFPVAVDSVALIDDGNANGYVYKWDAANNKLRIYQSAAVTPAGTIASHTHSVPAGTDAGGGTTGGTVAVFTGTATTAAGLGEVSTAFTPAATTLYAIVKGN